MLAQIVFVIAVLVGMTVSFLVLKRLWSLDRLANAVLTVIICVVSAFACGAVALRVLRFFGWTISG